MRAYGEEHADDREGGRPRESQGQCGAHDENDYRTKAGQPQYHAVRSFETGSGRCARGNTGAGREGGRRGSPFSPWFSVLMDRSRSSEIFDLIITICAAWSGGRRGGVR
ncbi:hypothetical protein GCM10023074_30240 [Microbispora amethystogenes]|uniref:Uncharacterized protein n=1 Tax=Microbispora amethystogenes TaxID=1427754 RepID=A0ABQ4FLB2_9ACTN|nr:hypothetical protein Mam01_57680 [Microbispora amethystogenes]